MGFTVETTFKVAVENHSEMLREYLDSNWNYPLTREKQSVEYYLIDSAKNVIEEGLKCNSAATALACDFYKLTVEIVRKRANIYSYCIERHDLVSMTEEERQEYIDDFLVDVIYNKDRFEDMVKYLTIEFDKGEWIGGVYDYHDLTRRSC